MGRIIVPLFLLFAGIAPLETPAAQAQQVDAAAVNLQKPALTIY